MKFKSNLKTVVALAFVLLGLSACSTSDGEENREEESVPRISENQPVEIESVFTKLEDFQKELKANGKMISNDRADLKFLTVGNIKAVFVSEGQTVRSGQLIAQIDDAELHSLIKESELGRRKALLDYEDQLLRLGYRLKDTANIDPETKSIAKLRSGLSQSEIAEIKIRQQLANTKLLAPFNGRVANLKAKPFNNSASFDFVCTLVNNNSLIVEFKVLEQELSFVQQSDIILITPFSLPDKKYRGKVKSINPIVDNVGMITVKAVVDHDGLLLDGMGVNVSVLQMVRNQIVIPKEAVLERQNRNVVFTVKNDSLAYWNYVDIEAENSKEYAIKSGLNLGDEVIYKGNFNLAHDRKVKRANN